MSTQNATLGDFVTDTPTPEDCSERFGCRLPNLDPKIARTLVENDNWSPSPFVTEFPDASPRDVNEYLREHDLYDQAEDNRPELANESLAAKLDTMNVEDFDAQTGGAD